jgi:hypothetical protein
MERAQAASDMERLDMNSCAVAAQMSRWASRSPQFDPIRESGRSSLISSPQSGQAPTELSTV